MAGIGATFHYAGIGALVLAFLARFAPEASGRSLEEVEAGVLRRG